jgi:hypothetical protein
LILKLWSGFGLIFLGELIFPYENNDDTKSFYLW